MEQLLLHLPDTPLGFFGLVLGIVFGLVLLMNKLRSDDLSTLRASNEDLRSSIEDKGKKLEQLTTEMGTLRKDFDDLSARHHSFESLIVQALQLYFAQNPRIARDIKKTVGRTQ